MKITVELTYNQADRLRADCESFGATSENGKIALEYRQIYEKLNRAINAALKSHRQSKRAGK
jgi:hypothetical protein